jgi:hypothetical protein
MPIRKIEDVGEAFKQCRDSEHSVPGMIALPPGSYVHECPSCGKKTYFRVNGPKLEGGRGWSAKTPLKTVYEGSRFNERGGSCSRSFMAYDLEWRPKPSARDSRGDDRG